MCVSCPARGVTRSSTKTRFRRLLRGTASATCICRSSVAYAGEDTGVRTWTWGFHLTYTDLVLPSMTVSGSGDWAVVWETYDYQLGEHTFSGETSVDGGDPWGTDFTATSTWTTLNDVQGTCHGTGVDWENPTPDAP